MEGRGSLCMLTLEMKKKCVRTRGIILGGNRELLTSKTSSDRTWIYYFSVTRHSQLVFGRVICFETHMHMIRIVFASDSESSDCGVSFCLKLCRGSKWTLKSLLDFKSGTSPISKFLKHHGILFNSSLNLKLMAWWWSCSTPPNHDPSQTKFDAF